MLKIVGHDFVDGGFEFSQAVLDPVQHRYDCNDSSGDKSIANGLGHRKEEGVEKEGEQD
jgi:hypothetical protein